MKHIPFAAMPPAERKALAEVLERSGMSLQRVCVSRMEPGSGEDAEAVATVTGAGWFRSYAAGPGWIGLLERDLIALRPAPAAQPAQSGLHDEGGPP